MLERADFTLIAEKLCSDSSPHPGSDMWCSVSSQVLEFDLKGTALDSASCIDVVVKDYETIGKDK